MCKMEKKKGYLAPPDPREEALLIEEVMADPEGRASYEEFNRLYAFKKAVVRAWKKLLTV